MDVQNSNHDNKRNLTRAIDKKVKIEIDFCLIDVRQIWQFFRGYEYFGDFHSLLTQSDLHDRSIRILLKIDKNLKN